MELSKKAIRLLERSALIKRELDSTIEQVIGQMQLEEASFHDLVVARKRNPLLIGVINYIEAEALRKHEEEARSGAHYDGVNRGLEIMTPRRSCGHRNHQRKK
jgi:hypothetical protein